MTDLPTLINDYLGIRRSLGATLDESERYLTSYLAYLTADRLDAITVATATAWARQPGGDPHYIAARYATIEIFSRWAHCLDARHDSLPSQNHPRTSKRIVPYLYTDDEVRALINETSILAKKIRQATLATLIGLLAVTGMRIGEAINLNRDDHQPGLLTITNTKFGKSRLVPIHTTTDNALAAYATLRDTTFPAPTTNAFFLSSVGHRLEYKNVHHTFHRLIGRLGITPLSDNCRPRIHDLRHTFAHRALADAYLTGRDPKEILPILSTYLGHVSPESTYWYLTAAPDLMQAAATRLLDLTEGA